MPVADPRWSGARHATAALSAPPAHRYQPHELPAPTVSPAPEIGRRLEGVTVAEHSHQERAPATLRRLSRAGHQLHLSHTTLGHRPPIQPASSVDAGVVALDEA